MPLAQLDSFCFFGGQLSLDRFDLACSGASAARAVLTGAAAHLRRGLPDLFAPGGIMGGGIITNSRQFNASTRASSSRAGRANRCWVRHVRTAAAAVRRLPASKRSALAGLGTAIFILI
jgi:hypothetical protein